MNKQDLESRIKEIGDILNEQGQVSSQINNNILMLHGAKQELEVWLKKVCDHACKDPEEKLLDASLQEVN